MQQGWRFWIDRGGTFTDVIAWSPAGAVSTLKLLSENPERYPDAAIAGIRQAMQLAENAPIPFADIAHVKMGTTVATNALLERKGAPTLFVVTKGFADLLTIGHQTRPRLFDLNIQREPPIHSATLEIDARVDLNGAELTPLDEAAILTSLKAARANGATACAIALVNAWKHPDLERRVAALARDAGFQQVTLSSQANPQVGLYGRAGTSVIDAYLSPILRRYVDSVANELGPTQLEFMQSSGGLVAASDFHGRDAIVSGPAGGVVGAVRTAQAVGANNIVGFDMGGTSTDVSLYAGQFERDDEIEIAGLPCRAPTLSIHTVAAGGGSILAFDGARYTVGPASAGADPGPACYRRGGPLTVTDANVMLGNLQPTHFPAIFGPNADEPLDANRVTELFTELAAQVSAATSEPATPHTVAEGFIRVAIANMAQAIRTITLEKGRDVRDFTLQCFGGAAGQHACRVADELGMRRALIHPFAGVLSACGIGLADQTAIRQQAIETPLADTTSSDAEQILTKLETEARAQLRDASNTTATRHAALRYTGADTAIRVPFATPDQLATSFHEAHRRQFGFATPDRPLTLESLSVTLTAPGEQLALPELPPANGQPPQPIDHAQLYRNGQPLTAPVLDSAGLRAGHTIPGPALIREAIATTIIEPGWQAEVAPHGELILTRTDAPPPAQIDADAAPDPVLLELFNNLFMGVADRMGVVLRNTSTSVNMKERLDFSCAVFDANGHLIANAPHVPVHLGAMGESVRTVLKSRGATLKPGDMIALNNPFNGGTHLPDVTLIAPVFADDGKTLRFFVANRGHHSDIGGKAPGSTPPDSTTLEEEGVVIDDFLIIDGGGFREADFRHLLASARYPARSPDVNVSDIKAQAAANETGARELAQLVDKYGWPGVSAYMTHIKANAEEHIRRVIDRLGEGRFKLELDDGAYIEVSIRPDGANRSVTVDFTGTSPQRSGNLNAPPAVTRAATLYAFRCLVGEDLPLNEGCLAPIEIIAPEGCLLAPSPGAAVVAGNTETSQAVTNALLGALNAAAASQGTMNNLLIGNDDFQYYETICGGAGATPNAPGAPAIHTHMTNTRITDPEILELRYPLRVEQFAFRPHSGGAGQHKGGDGAVRTIRALSNVTVSLVSSSRRVAPFGLAGGAPGATGNQLVKRADGTTETIDGVSAIDLNEGDTVEIQTPGGGGWGEV